MIRLGKYLLQVVLFLVVSAFMACTQERQPCLSPDTASLNVKSVEIRPGGIVADTPIRAAVFIALTNNGMKGRVFLKASSFTLSLSQLADTCLWAFAPDTAAGTPIDTLTFRYQRQLQFISNACGYDYFYQITSVTSTHKTIDSAIIKNPSVNNNVNTSHLQLYIHPHN